MCRLYCMGDIKLTKCSAYDFFAKMTIFFIIFENFIFDNDFIVYKLYSIIHYKIIIKNTLCICEVTTIRLYNKKTHILSYLFCAPSSISCLEITLKLNICSDLIPYQYRPWRKNPGCDQENRENSIFKVKLFLVIWHDYDRTLNSHIAKFVMKI